MSRGSVIGVAVMILDPSLARRFYNLARLKDTRPLARTNDGEVYELISQIFELGYGDVTIPRNRTQPEPTLNEEKPLGTHAAATLLGLGEPAVRKALREHRLAGELVNGRWTIHPTAITDYRNQAS